MRNKSPNNTKPSQNRRLIALAAAAVFALAAGVGYATIPGSNGVIDGCYGKKGALRVIDAEAGESCLSGETPINWNQQGPQGPPGPPGVSATNLWAHVRGDGLLIKDRGAVSATRIDTGLYRVTFERSIEDCVGLSAVSVNTGWANASQFAQDTLQSITVVTHTAASGDFPADQAFVVTILC